MADEIFQDKQKFAGIMDASSDMTVVKKGHHRSSYNFRSVTANENQFIFISPKGTTERVAIKDGYKIAGWTSYENSLFVLSKPWSELLNFSYLNNSLGNGNVTIVFPAAHGLLVGDIIYFERTDFNEFEGMDLSGKFEVLSVVSTTVIEIGLKVSTILKFGVGSLSSSGVVEKLQRGEFGEIKVNRETGDLTYTPLYNHKKLSISLKKYISREGFKINKENQKILRAYFTDYLSSPRVINARADIFHNVVLSGNMQEGKSYMVLSGTIDYFGVEFGPGTAAGNIFTVPNGGALTYSGSGRLIEYYPVELLDWTPNYSQGEIHYTQHEDYEGLPTGTVICGTYSSTYRLIDDQGAKSPWSLPTNPIYVGKGGASTTLQGYHERMGSLSNESSGKALKFRISNIDQNWKKLQVAIVRHIDEIAFEQPVIFYEEEITDSIQIATYSGNNSLGTFNIQEINQFTRWFKKVMTIETMQNIMVPSNFESGSILSGYEPSAPEIGYVIKNCFTDEVISTELSTASNNDEAIMQGDTPWPVLNEFPWPLTGHKNDLQNPFGKPLLSLNYYEAIDTGLTEIQSVSGSIFYNKNAIFQVADDDGQQVVVTADRNVCAVVLVKKHQSITGIVDTDDMIEDEIYLVVGGDIGTYLEGHMFRYTGQSLTFGVGESVTWTGYKAYRNADYHDGNGMVVQSEIGTFPRREKVRVGIIPVDKKGIKLPPRFLGDYTFPSMQTEPLSDDMNDEAYENRYITYLRHIGLKIGTEESPVDLSDILDQISGFHIVIAPLKRKIKLQGLMSDTVRKANDPVRIGPEMHTYLDVDGHKKYDEDNPGWLPTDYPYGYDRGKVIFSPDILFKLESELGITPNDQIYIEGYLEDKQWENFESDSGGWVALKGTRYQTPDGTAESNLMLFHKFNALSSNQTSNKSDPGETLEIDGSTKITTQGSAIWPTDPDITYDTIAISDFTNRFPSSSLKRYRSQVVNHLLVAHGSDFDFGKQDNEMRLAPIVSIQSPDDISYGNTEFTEFVSTGHFQPITALHISKMAGIFYDIEVFGGQSFLSLFSQVRQIQLPFVGDVFDDEDYTAPGLNNIICYVAESQIYPYRRTFEFAAKDREILQGNNQPESTIVNDENKYTGNLIRYAALIDIDYENTLFERSSAYSLTKINGETFDSFREFLFGNYRTAESALERITSSHKNGQFLMLWHEKGVSYYPINDRAVISDSQGGQVRIGYGGIMDQNFPIWHSDGLQDRQALVSTENHFVWLAKRTQNILQIAKGSKPEYLNEKNVLDTFLEEMLVPTATAPNITEVDDPYYNTGIVGGYNPKFKEIYFSVYTTNRSGRSRIFVTESQHKTLVISALTLQPTGYLSMIADMYMWIDKWLYSTMPIPPLAVAGSLQNFARTFYYQNLIYIANVEDVIPGDLSTLPASTVFLDFARVHSIHQHNEGAFGQFYGIANDLKLTIIFNSPADMYKSFDALFLHTSQQPDNIKWTTESIDSSATTAEETTVAYPWQQRDRGYIKSFPLTVAKFRPKGEGIEVELTYFARSTGAITVPGQKANTIVRQADLIYRIKAQK